MKHPTAFRNGAETGRRFSVARRLVCCTFLALAWPACNAQPEASPALLKALMGLGGMFVEDGLSTAMDVCGQRIPASRPVWTDASRQWHTDHHEQLVALKEAEASIEKALRTTTPSSRPLDMTTFVMYRAQAVSLVLYALATSDDAKASSSCDNLRALFLARADQDRDLDRALADATLVLGAFPKR
jgi:hypothetical protein